MAGHGSPPPKDRASHPGRRVSRDTVAEQIDQRNRVLYHILNYRQATGTMRPFPPAEPLDKD